MPEVPIQVKKEVDMPKKPSTDTKVDLKNGKQPPKKAAGLWWVVLIILILTNLLTIGYFSFFKQTSAELTYTQYVLPDQAIVFSVMNKDQLYDKIKPWSLILGGHFSFFQWFVNQAADYCQAAGLDYEADINPLFQQKAALVLYQEPDQPNSFPFVIFLEKKAASAQINTILEQLNSQFKKDFYQTDELYRQNNVVSLKSIKHSSLVFYHTQIANYFLISNSKKYLEATIDLMISNSF